MKGECFCFVLLIFWKHVFQFCQKCYRSDGTQSNICDTPFYFVFAISHFTFFMFCFVSFFFNLVLYFCFVLFLISCIFLIIIIISKTHTMGWFQPWDSSIKFYLRGSVSILNSRICYLTYLFIISTA